MDTLSKLLVPLLTGFAFSFCILNERTRVVNNKETEARYVTITNTISALNHKVCGFETELDAFGDMVYSLQEEVHHLKDEHETLFVHAELFTYRRNQQESSRGFSL